MRRSISGVYIHVLSIGAETDILSAAFGAACPKPPFGQSPSYHPLVPLFPFCLWSLMLRIFATCSYRAILCFPDSKPRNIDARQY
ncbi:hypothetical protein IW262DRAFT_138836 [Armillaria fumosa]|nr:hypothetical protein IW262DRAFT_138836 [Armillaria fumosa]